MSQLWHSAHSPGDVRLPGHDAFLALVKILIDASGGRKSTSSLATQATKLVSQCADNTKLGEVVDAPESYAIRGNATGCHPVDLSSLEKWANRALMQFNKGKHKIPHLGRINLIHQCVRGARWLESSLAEKVMGVWVNTKLNVSQLNSNVPL